MKKIILATILRVAKTLGFFALARRITAGDLRILCYHGAALADENEFRPGLFMTHQDFSARMQFLADHDYRVLRLDDALERLKQRDLPNGSTVITIDDGWYGTYSVMVPVLRRHQFPSTLYISSYYLQKQTQVLNVAVAYLLWKGGDRILDLSTLGHELTGSFCLALQRERDVAAQEICDVAESIGHAEARQALLTELARALDVDWRSVQADRLISFMDPGEAREAIDAGVDVQLHTHRHRFPDSDFESARKEIDDNREALSVITSDELIHFCYPSGEYTKEQVPWLKRLDIVSATTTDRGFNRADVSPYELTRFLDSGTVTPLEFEAEMCGFLELIRRCGYSI